jgi:pimeloyl-ACP methyl ester carboxylesterase
MRTVTSEDGTSIAFDRSGSGPALILIDGALCGRNTGAKPELAALLAPHFTVYSYDRRGRGDSGDTQPYSVDREIDDIAALIEDAGGHAGLYGHSSGAALGLEAAVKLGQDLVTKLAMYEVPYNDDPQAQLTWHRYLGRLREALAAGRRGDAVALFMSLVGQPERQIEAMRQSPYWAGTEAIAPTLSYDHEGVMGPDGTVPAQRAARVLVPALALAGQEGLAFMRVTAAALAQALPHGQTLTLAGQNHSVDPAVLAPVLIEFFGT